MKELFTFFSEIDGGQITADKVLGNIASIVVSTNETLDIFIKLHKVESKVQQEMGLV